MDNRSTLRPAPMACTVRARAESRAHAHAQRKGPTVPTTTADDIDVLADLGAIEAELAAELAAPRSLTETGEQFRARQAAADDIAADLLAETGTGPDDDAAVLAFPAPAPAAAAPLAS